MLLQRRDEEREFRGERPQQTLLEQGGDDRRESSQFDNGVLACRMELILRALNTIEIGVKSSPLPEPYHRLSL